MLSAFPSPSFTTRASEFVNAPAVIPVIIKPTKDHVIARTRPGIVTGARSPYLGFKAVKVSMK